MDPRRLPQLDRAAKLRASVNVLFGQNQDAPIVVDLASVRRTHLQNSSRIYVQVISWLADRSAVELVVLDDPEGQRRATEEDLARGVDEALDRFEERARAASEPS